MHYLRAVALEIADELGSVGKELERRRFRQRASGQGLIPEVGADKVKNYYSRLEERWEALVTETRNIPGFERFPLSIPFEELTVSAKLLSC